MADAEITNLLIDWNHGDESALDRLIPVVYDELRRLAGRCMSQEGPGHTLQSTAVVHEAYLKLFDQQRVQWQNRTQFFAVAAQLIRRILVDHARGANAAKRGGVARKLSLDENLGVFESRDLDLVALDDAMAALARFDPQQSRVIELRFFAGLTIEETAETLGVSPTTVKRDWITAKAWLFNELNRATPAQPNAAGDLGG
jgi:RNA polymerase sigma factor (TIGR02999 family)